MYIADKPFWMIALFIGIVIFLLILDLTLFNKKDHEISIKESLYLSAFYISMALCFGFWILHQFGTQSFMEYLTGYLIEKSLSLDNVFVISLVFSTLSIPRKYQHRVLFFGILGVIILRALMIYAGSHLVANFWWIIYVFSAFMIYVGVRMLFIEEIASDIQNNAILQFMQKHFRVTRQLHGNNFLVKKTDPKTKKPRWFLTPLLLALVVIEFIDLVFAIDSVPAIFIITNDPYIIYTSNIFAILGLRALYFALSVLIVRFYYLKFSLALILIFIGSKTFIADILDIEKFPAYISLAVTFGLLLAGGLFSWYKEKR